jgi:hypothetical protein
MRTEAAMTDRTGNVTMTIEGRTAGDGWPLRALCRTRPADWWEVGDDGNRLAIALCRLACPVIAQCATAAGDQEAGVVRAGIAYADTGRVLDVCGCGRPVLGQSAVPGRCRTCEPPAVRIRRRPPGRPRKATTGTGTRGGDRTGRIRHLAGEGTRLAARARVPAGAGQGRAA